MFVNVYVCVCVLGDGGCMLHLGMCLGGGV